MEIGIEPFVSGDGYWDGEKRLPAGLGKKMAGKTFTLHYTSYPVYKHHRVLRMQKELSFGKKPSLPILVEEIFGAIGEVYDKYLPKDGTEGVELLHSFDELWLEWIGVDTEALTIQIAMGS